MASLYKRKLKTGYVWVIEYKIDGKRVKRHLGSHISKREALLIKKEIELELQKRKFPVLQNKTRKIKISDLWKDFEAKRGFEIAESTMEIYERSIINFIKTMGDILLSEITADTIEIWKTKRIKDGLKPTTINIEFRHLKGVFSYAFHKNYILENPFTKTKQIPVDKKIPPVIPSQHIKKFFSVIDDPKDLAFFLTLYYTGCRPREAWELTWDRYNPETRLAHLTNTKGNKDRLIYFPPKLHEIITQLPKTSNRIFDQFSSGWEPAKAMKRYLKKAELPLHYSPKYFRHTFATIAMQKSKDTFGVKNSLGHSSIKVTEIYTHYDIENKKKIVESIPDPI